MTKLARLTLTTALMGSLALPALAQSGATSGVLMQPTAKAVPGLHHRTARNPNHVHHIADTVRTPAMTSGSIPAAPATVPSKGLAVNDNTAMTSPAPAVGSSTSVQGKDTMVNSKASATSVVPAAKPSVTAVSPSVAAPPAPALSTAPHAAGTTASPALPRVQ